MKTHISPSPLHFYLNIFLEYIQYRPFIWQIHAISSIYYRIKNSINVRIFSIDQMKIYIYIKWKILKWGHASTLKISTAG